MAILLAGALFLGALSSDGTLEDLAAEAGVEVADLQGAVNSTGLSPLDYLLATGEVSRAPATDPAVEGRLDCISWFESRHTPGARNQRSGAAGEFQFMAGTWRGTPQGKAGLSPYDPVAAREAARWMIGQGRVREWTVVQRGLC